MVGAKPDAFSRGVFDLLGEAPGDSLEDLLPDCGWFARDSDCIQRCGSTGAYNGGIATCPSGFVVIDLDTLKPDQSPTAPLTFYQTGGRCWPS